jgi:fructose-bisphosphate aldolase class II
MKTLREYIADAEKKHVAIGHFNISNIEGFWAVVKASRETKLPVIIGVSEGERDFVGVRQVRALVDSVNDGTNPPVFLNADHTYSLDRIKEAIDARFDSVIIDGAKLPLEENIKITKEAVEYARSKGTGILVEGELGYIGQSSKILDALPEGVTGESMTEPAEAKEFVELTGIDLFAPSVGNIHGMLRGGGNPHLDSERVSEVRGVAGVPLVLHGGSGNTDEDFRLAIAAGISIVHINTEIRIAWRDALKKSLQDDADEIAPYKLLKSSVLAMQKVIEKKLQLFNGE